MPDPQPNPSSRGPLRRFADGDYVDRDGCDRAFERMHRRDALGDRIHLIFAIGGIVCLFGPPTMTEIAMAPLAVFFFVRIINTFPVWIHGFGQPAVLVALAIAGWMGISLAWSQDIPGGLEEMSDLRWIALAGLIFPVIEHRIKLIAAMCVGIALGHIGQILDLFDGFGIAPVADLVENHPGRVGGWWHPVVGGSVLVAAMGLHLPAVLMGTGRTRWLGWAGFAAATLGLLATGSRGAWGAGVLMVGFAIVWGLVMRRIAVRRTIVLGVAAIAVAIVGGLIFRDAIVSRVDESRIELREMAAGDYSSYSGIRVRMAQLALDAFADHPITGVGGGGYQAYSRSLNTGAAAHSHAHNSALHIGATLGLIGLALWALLAWVMLRDAGRIWDERRHNPYGLGPMFAIVGLLLASLTDTVHVNQQSAAMIGLLAALSPAMCPGHPLWRRGRTDISADSE